MSLNTQKLINDILQFINNERELYGDFTVPALHTSKTSDQNSLTSLSSVEDPSPQYQPDDQHSDNMEYFDDRVLLFNSGENKNIYHQIGQCHTLDELRKLCQQANVLRTDLNNTNLVFGVGNSDADLILVGEAPGAEEDKQGEPFVGAAGKLLNKILDAINFDRNQVYITNILKHRPPNNRNPNAKERQQSLPFLLRQIDLISPKLILCLGKVAAQTLLDNDNTLSSMRGSFHSFRGKYELMATYHPAALLRHADWKRPTWNDMQLLRKRYDELGCKP